RLEAADHDRAIRGIGHGSDVLEIRFGGVAVPLLLLVDLAEPPVCERETAVDLERAQIALLRAGEVGSVGGTPFLCLEQLREPLLAGLSDAGADVAPLVGIRERLGVE